MKARGTLLMALPNKDQLKFHSYQDEKLLMEAIEKGYGGNKESKKDLEQIDLDYLEEIDLHWETAMLTIRARSYMKRTDRNLDMNGQRISFDKLKVEGFNYHKNGHFARECKAPKNQDNRGREYGRKTVLVETSTKNALIAQDRTGGYDWSYQAEKEIPTNYAFMALTSSGSSSSSESKMPSKRDLRLIDEHFESVYVDVISNIAPSDVKTVKTIDVNHKVLTRLGKINIAGASVNIVFRPVNTAGSKSTVNHPRMISNAFKRVHSQVIRPFNKYSSYKKTIFNKEVNAVKASGCWVWRPKEARLKLMELMKLCTKLSDRVLDLEKKKTAQAKEIANLKKKVKKLERKRRSRTPKMNLFKIGTSRRRSLGEDDASKHGRNLKQRRAEKKTTNQSLKEESNMILSDLLSHSTRSEEVFGYILLVKIKLLIKKLDD
nr:hypothetical protein [Tanacetum cinerariifolium]